jgi:hypothetical protein
MLPQNSTKCVSSGTRLAHARHVHQEVCSILLASYETLQARLQEYMKLLPSWQQLKLETTDCFQRFSNLSDLAKVSTGELQLRSPPPTNLVFENENHLVTGENTKYFTRMLVHKREIFLFKRTGAYVVLFRLPVECYTFACRAQ